MRNLFVLLIFISGMLLSTNAFSATYDATGKWNYSTYNDWDNCGDPVYSVKGSAIISQSGNNVTVFDTIRGTTYNGSVDGSTYTVSATYSEDGGTTKETINFTLTSSMSGNGNAAWTWTVPGYSCKGGFNFTFQKISVFSNLEKANIIFNWLESEFPDILSPTPQPTNESDDIYFRYYPGTNVYIGTIQNDLYFYDHLGVLHNLGSVDTWLPFAQGN